MGKQAGQRGQILIAVGVVMLAATVLLLLVYVQSVQAWDFGSFYTAGKLVLHQRHQLYSSHVQFVEQTLLTHDPKKFAPWAHLPIEAVLFAPLSLLPFRLAFTLWGALTLLQAAFLGYLLREYLKNYFALVMLLAPIIAGLFIGQNHLLPALLIVGGFLQLRKQKETSAGVFFGVALLRFQFTVPFLLFFLVVRRFKLVSIAAVVGVALFMSSFAIAGRNFLSQYHALSILLNNYDIYIINQLTGIRGFFGTILIHHQEIALTITAVTCFALLGIGLRTWIRAGWHPAADDFDLLFALALFVSLAVSYHSFHYDLTLAGVAAVLVIRHEKRATRLDIAILIPYFATLICPVIGFVAPLFTVGAALRVTYLLSQPKAVNESDVYVDSTESIAQYSG